MSHRLFEFTLEKVKWRFSWSFLKVCGMSNWSCSVHNGQQANHNEAFNECGRLSLRLKKVFDGRTGKQTVRCWHIAIVRSDHEPDVCIFDDILQWLFLYRKQSNLAFFAFYFLFEDSIIKEIFLGWRRQTPVHVDSTLKCNISRSKERSSRWHHMKVMSPYHNSIDSFQTNWNIFSFLQW